jgi:hypothetical protein
MRSPEPLPTQLSSGPFVVNAAVSSGLVAAGRLRRRDLVTPTRGVRVVRSLGDDVRTRMIAVGLVLDAEQFFSHVTALQLWGCPVPRRVEYGDLHVSSPTGRAIERRRGVRGHRVDRRRMRARFDVTPPRSSPARAWYESRSLLTVRDLVIVGDHLIGKSGLADLAELASVIRAGDRGVAAARVALGLVRLGSESPMETIVRLIVVEAGFPEPALNIDVHDAAGVFLGRVDMAWPELRIAIEYDGEHHRERDVFQRDRRRQGGFAVAGWIVLHVTAVDARQSGPFIARLREAFLQRMGR